MLKQLLAKMRGRQNRVRRKQANGHAKQPRQLGFEGLEDRNMFADGTGFRVVLDPGHGGGNIGTAGIESHVAEKSLTLDMATRVERYLKDMDFTVDLTRRSDTDPSFYDRTTLAKAFNADMFVSLHFNGFSQLGMRGTEALVMATNVNPTDDTRLAETLIRWTTQSFASPVNRGVQVTDTRTGVLMDDRLGNTAQQHPVVSALLEIESISSNVDVDRYFNVGSTIDANRNRVASNIAQGIAEAARTMTPHNAQVGAPSLTVSAASSSRLNLNWTNVANEDGYKVYRWDGSQSVQIAKLGRDVTSYSVTGLAAGSSQWFYVSAFNATSEAASNWQMGTTTAAPQVGTPSLTVSAASSSRLNLNWTNVANEDSYKVYRWDGSQAVQIAKLGRDVTSYSVTGLAAGSSQWFYVSAFNATSEAFSSWQMGTTTVIQLSLPGALNSRYTSANAVELSWTDTNVETGYVLLEWINGNWQPARYLGANTTRVTVSGLSRGMHYFLVQATAGSQATYTTNYASAYFN